MSFTVTWRRLVQFHYQFIVFSVNVVSPVFLFTMPQFKLVPLNLSFRSLLRKANKSCSKFSLMWCLIPCTIFCMILIGCLFKKLKKQELIKHPDAISADPVYVRLADNVGGCLLDDCRAICANMKDLNESLMEVLQNNNCSTIEKLQIEEYTFRFETLSKNWITSTTTFSKIIIAHSYLEAIENEAFNTDAFISTFSLTLINLPIKMLGAGVLLGLSKLEYLTIACDLEDIDRGFFQPVSGSLRFLRLNYMRRSIKIRQIFGISKMINLIHLDLSSNNFDEPITMHSFRYLKKLEYLNLSNSKITSLGKEAFAPLKDSLKFLDLSHNQINRINSNTFESILINGKAYISLSENPWICDCDVLPLIEYYKRYPERFMDRPYCKSPRSLFGKTLIENSDQVLCSLETTIDDRQSPEGGSPILASSSETGSSSTAITVAPEFNNVTTSSTLSQTVAPNPTPLVNGNSFKVVCAESGKEEKRNYNFITLLPPRYEFSIELITDTSAKVTVKNQNEVLTLLWHSEQDEARSTEFPQGNYDCKTDFNNSIIVTNLKQNVSYTFCLLLEDKTTVSPFNCQPFYVPLSRSSRQADWITKDKKITIIFLISFATGICICFGGLITFVIIKRHPNLLKGSRHVVVVEESNKLNVAVIYGKTGVPHFGNLLKKRKKITPPPPYESVLESLSTFYEKPVDTKSDCVRRHTFSFNKDEFVDASPASPPPLPKRNSEPIYSFVVKGSHQILKN